MKILICHSNTFFGLGGADTAAREISKVFLNLGHEVHFLQRAENWKSEKIGKIFFHNYPKVKMPSWPRFYSGVYISALRKNMYKKIKQVKEIEKSFDLILCTTPITNSLVLKIFPNQKIILRLPAIEASEVKNTWDKRDLKKKLQGILVKRYEARAVKQKRNLLLTNSENSKKLLDKYYPRHAKSIVLKNGIADVFFQKSGTEKRSPIIISPSRLSVEKNLTSLVSACSFIKNKDFKFHIFGDGELKGVLEEQIKNKNLQKKIFIFSYTSQIKKEYYKSKIMVLPSTHESFGLVLVEAMACGLPCIAFRPDGKKIITASDEIIKNGKTGFLVKDEKEMAKKIDLLISNKVLWKKMSNNAKKEAKAYSWEGYVGELLKNYKSFNLTKEN